MKHYLRWDMHTRDAADAREGRKFGHGVPERLYAVAMQGAARTADVGFPSPIGGDPAIKGRACPRKALKVPRLGLRLRGLGGGGRLVEGEANPRLSLTLRDGNVEMSDRERDEGGSLQTSTTLPAL